MEFSELQKRVSECKQIRSSLPIVPDIIEGTQFLDEIYEEPKLALRVFCIKAGISCTQKIPVCANPSCTKYAARHSSGGYFIKTCSNECKLVLRTVTYKKNFMIANGVSNPSLLPEVNEKRKNTVLERYGVDNVAKSRSVQKKKTDTLIKTTGYKSTFENPETQKKIQNTFDVKFNGNPMYSDDVKQKAIETKKKNGTMCSNSTFSKSAHTKGTITKKLDRIKAHPERAKLDDRSWLADMVHRGYSLEHIGEITNTSAQTVLNRINDAGIVIPDKHTSSPELEIKEFLASHGIYVEKNKNKISPYEIDLFSDKHQIGIEFDGLRWHSTLMNKDISHLKKKQDKCDDVGVRLIQIYEDEWREKKPIIKSKLLSTFGVSDRERIYARHTKFVELSGEQTVEIYKNHHIQGRVYASHHYGLIDKNDTLVACMSFSKPRNDKTDGVYELVRFATAVDVVGGFSKLLKNAIGVLKPLTIISFADRRFSDGNLYKVNGFVHTDTTKVSYFYVIGKKRAVKGRYSRRRIEERYNRGELKFFDPQLSERQNMELNGIYQIPNSGLLKFELDLTNT